MNGTLFFAVGCFMIPLAMAVYGMLAGWML
jgi:hypothetical protein